MESLGLSLLRLLMVSLWPMLLTGGIYLVEDKIESEKIPYRTRQIFIGILFGGLAVLGTECGVDIQGVNFNARDAAPLCAGLLFGAPAGLIAGIIGGVERWFAVIWGAEAYTRLASSLSTILAGIFGAWLRKYLFEDKKPQWYHALAAGVLMGVVHMLISFLAQMNDAATAFLFIRSCSLPMIAMSGLSVLFPALLPSRLWKKEKKQSRHQQRTISEDFQRGLLACVTAGFLVTTLFTWVMQTQLSVGDARELLKLNAEDVCEDVLVFSDTGSKETDEKVYAMLTSLAKTRHVGADGCIILVDKNQKIISDRYGNEGKPLNVSGISPDQMTAVEGEPFEAVVYGQKAFCTYVTAGEYLIFAVIPQSEVLFSRDISVYGTAFMEFVIFGMLFIVVYFLIKKVVVDNMQQVNRSLEQITDGNLDVVVDVRSNEEFSSLSDDINQTVQTLKRYIAEAAARIDQELEFASAIQHAALPAVFPHYPDRTEFELFASMDTAKEVGGDFYDFYFTGENKLGFLIADVSGKGIPAAMFMMTSKTVIKGYAESGKTVDEVFTLANKKLCENNEAGMFVTAWMGILDLTTGMLEFANAGHNRPLLRHADGSFEYLQYKPGLMLAGLDGIKYKKNEIRLSPGDEIYLYTDGVTEAANSANELYGDERLLAFLNTQKYRSGEEICRAVKENVMAFAEDVPQFDDITMLYLKYQGGMEDERDYSSGNN